MKDFKISNEAAKQDKLFYVVANIIIIDRQKRACLLLKRSDREKVHPGKWAFPGGKLEHSEVKDLILKSGNSPIDGVDDILGVLAAREAKEECGLDVKDDGRVIKNKVFIRPDGVPVFMALLASEYAGGQVKIEDGAISDSAWVKEDELEDYDCIDGVIEEASIALRSA